MSHFLDEFQRQLATAKLSATALAEKAGRPAALTTRWVSGHSVPSLVSIDEIAPLLSTDPDDHARLVVARLRDLYDGPVRHMIEIAIKPDYVLRDRPRKLSQWERTLEFLSEHRRENRELNDLLVNLAKLLGCDDL